MHTIYAFQIKKSKHFKGSAMPGAKRKQYLLYKKHDYNLYAF